MREALSASRLREAALGCLLVLGVSCSSATGEATRRAETVTILPPLEAQDARVTPSSRSPLVLVTIDGARWQEIFQGADPERLAAPDALPAAADLVPHLHAMDASLGAPGHGLIRATGPNFVSLPGYREILTGRASAACQDNDCPRTTTDTVLDEASEAGLRVAAFASWERLDRAATARPGAFRVSAGRGGDRRIEPWPGEGDFRPDAITARLALEHLEQHRPDVLFLGLGEPDEYAHHGDYAGYLRALRAADDVVGELQATLARMGERGASTCVFVTADHGRARDFRNHGGFAPESGRVWLFASGPRIRAQKAVRSTAERHLSDIAPTMRVLLGLAHETREPGSGTVLGELLGGT